MIFIDKDLLTKSKETTNLIEIEKAFLNSNILLQKKKKESLLNYLNKISDSINNIDVESANNIHGYLEQLKKAIDLCNENIEHISRCILSIDNVIFSIKNNIEPDLKKLNLEYAELNKILIKNTLDIENCFISISKKSCVSFSFNSTNNTNVEPERKDTPSNKKDITLESMPNLDFDHIQFPDDIKEIEFNISPIPTHVENALVISEKNGTVTLPYYMSKLDEIMYNSNGEFKSIDEVILDKYTLPIEMFKNPFIARFKEAIYLMRHKEHKSIFSAIALGLELMFNYKLHPAVISACKNIDELDTYLDYLQTGETDEFKCFKIIFDFAPVLSKNNNL